MIAVDTNILVYANRDDSRWNDAAKRCMRELAEGREMWAIPWPCIHEFLAVVTNPRIYRPCCTLDGAIDQIDAWRESPSVRLLGAGHAHWRSLKSTLLDSKTIGPAVHDARIAAICMEHGVSTLWSADRDFSKFHGLKIVNPLR